MTAKSGQQAPKTVLVYSCGETIGDGLFKLPFVRSVRRRFPEARITWLAGLGPSMYASLLAPAVAGLLDEVIEKADIGDDTRALLPWEPRPLAGRHFDLVIDTQITLRRSLVVRRIRHGRFVSAAARYLLSDRCPPLGTKTPRHLLAALDLLLDLAAPGGEKASGWVETAPADYRALAAELLPEGPIYVGIAPGAGDTVKVWPEANFLKIARRQVAAGRVPVIFAGPNEAQFVARWREAVPAARFPEWDRTDDRADLKGPMLAIALAGRLSAALANDSGTGHMLAAGGAPLVSLFSKHDPAKYAPTARRLQIVDSKNYGGKDPSLIPVEAVAAALEEMLSPSGP